MANKLIDITGNKYGMLTPIKYLGNQKWLCQCDCGNQSIHYAHHLKHGDVKSCGCMTEVWREQTRGFHQESKTRLYHIWDSMKQRCYNHNHVGYKWYGEKGIKVCEEWMDYLPFREWALSSGYAEDLSLDRVDSDKDYCPENCRWVTQTHQANNKSNNKYIEFDGKKLTYSQWAKETGLNKQTIRRRNLAGWSAEDILTTPIGQKPKSKTQH